MYGALPQTGITVMTLGGVALARPVLAVSVAAALIGVGVILRITGRRRNTVAVR